MSYMLGATSRDGVLLILKNIILVFFPMFQHLKQIINGLVLMSMKMEHYCLLEQ